MLAMHMPNEVLTPKVAFFFIIMTALVLMLASWRTRKTYSPTRVPLMGVMGAFIFATQMINFPLPGLPVSGHLGGGVLLAVVLGPHAGTLVMASVLIIQCLIFQDGGLLALGTNILNLGVVPCYIGYAVFVIMSGPRPPAAKLYLAVFIATLVGMLCGAALVPFEIAFSGLLAVPFGKMMMAMLSLHLIVALVEAIATFLVIGYISRVRPQSIGPVAERLVASSAGLSPAALAISLLITAVLLGGIGSRLASSHPDALESIISPEDGPTKVFVKENTNPSVTRVSAWQEKTAPLPDYQWTSTSGLLGTGVTLGLVWLIGMALRRSRASGASTRDIFR
jgi:cobalt/nickel transport system permease protein